MCPEAFAFVNIFTPVRINIFTPVRINIYIHIIRGYICCATYQTLLRSKRYGT